MSKLELSHELIREIFKSDPTFYIEVKQAILRSAVKHDAGRLLDQMSRDEMRRVIQDEIQSFEAEPGKIATNSPTARMREQVRTAIRGDIHDMIVEEFKKNEESFQAMAAGAINANVAKIIDAEVTKRLRIAMAALSQGGYPDATQ